MREQDQRFRAALRHERDVGVGRDGRPGDRHGYCAELLRGGAVVEEPFPFRQYPKTGEAGIGRGGEGRGEVHCVDFFEVSEGF